MPSAQASMFGDATPTDRLFFALYPSTDAAAAIAQRSRDATAALGLRGHAVDQSRLHVTLNHLGDYAGLPRHVVDAAMRAGDAIRHAAFDVRFDRLACFHDKAVVLRGADTDLADLIGFQSELARAMSREGLQKVVDKRYTPHITLVYDRQPIEPRAIAPVQWQATEFALVNSWLGKTHHEVLARWALQG